MAIVAGAETSRHGMGASGTFAIGRLARYAPDTQSCKTGRAYRVGSLAWIARTDCSISHGFARVGLVSSWRIDIGGNDVSLPFYSITCTGCDFTDSYSFGVRFEYSGPAEQEPMHGIAWCKDCDHIVNTCTPFTREHAEAEINDIEAWIARNKQGLFARFSRTKKDEIRKSQQGISAVQSRLAYFQSTDFKPRCLSCGSHTVFSFHLPYGDYGELEKLNIEHSCGGQLMISMDGRFSFRHHPTVVFDKAGVIIRDERQQHAGPAVQEPVSDGRTD